MTEWHAEENLEYPALGVVGWVIAVGRLGLIFLVIYSLMLVYFVFWLIEIPFRGRPLTAWVVQAACILSLWILGMHLQCHGDAMGHDGAIVANHASWIDVFVLNSAARVSFVAKTEVRRWPLIGFIARVAGTVFIQRRASDAKNQKSQFEDRLLAGDRLLFFPEGTSTDSRRVLKFKPTLFAAFFSKPLIETMWIQPASVIYTAPPLLDRRFYGWWGEMAFAPHFLAILGARKSGAVEIVFHPPVRVADFETRKTLAAHCEGAVRQGLEDRIKRP